MPKRANKRRKDGLIAVQVFIGRENGKRKYRTVYGKTQKEAQQKADQIKIDLGKGLDVSAERDTFSMWANRFLANKQSAHISDGQIQNYRSTISFLNKSIGSLEIKKIRAHHIQETINDLAVYNPNTRHPAAKRTLKFILSTAKQVLQLAVKNQVMDYNVAQDVDIPSNAPINHRRALTAEEQQWIINTPHRAQLPAMIMLYAGLRRGELMALKWNDIDLELKTIRVNKAVAVKHGKLQVKPFTKSKAGMRTISIPQRLVDFLNNERAKVHNTNSAKSSLVCPTAHGKLMSDIAWRRLWESYLKDINWKYGHHLDTKGKPAKSKYNKNGILMEIPAFSAHWLRHTYATMLYLAGVDIMTAKEQLGHADIKTTLAIYTHLDQQYKRKSMTKLDAYLSKSEKDAVKGQKGCEGNASKVQVDKILTSA